jgi:hypothetical protein
MCLGSRHGSSALSSNIEAKAGAHGTTSHTWLAVKRADAGHRNARRVWERIRAPPLLGAPDVMRRDRRPRARAAPRAAAGGRPRSAVPAARPRGCAAAAWSPSVCTLRSLEQEPRDAAAQPARHGAGEQREVVGEGRRWQPSALVRTPRGARTRARARRSKRSACSLLESALARALAGAREAWLGRPSCGAGRPFPMRWGHRTRRRRGRVRASCARMRPAPRAIRPFESPGGSGLAWPAELRRRPWAPGSTAGVRPGTRSAARLASGDARRTRGRREPESRPVGGRR